MICTYIQIVENWKPIRLLITIIAKCTTKDIYVFLFLHTYSSTVEILKNSIWNWRTLFSKTNKSWAKKCGTY
jgi:hypothetical protein